jgi:hypothetical protein
MVAAPSDTEVEPCVGRDSTEPATFVVDRALVPSSSSAGLRRTSPPSLLLMASLVGVGRALEVRDEFVYSEGAARIPC